MTKELSRLVHHVIAKAKRNEVTVSLLPVRFVISVVPCSGYFSNTEMHLACATQRAEPLWAGTLLHEFHHLYQWRDGSPAWYATWVDEDVDAGFLLDLWLRGFVELQPEQVTRYADLVRRMELDCERTTARTLRQEEWDLGIDPVEYTRGANAYVFFHELMARERVWCKPGSLFWNNKSLMEVCPDHFLPAEAYSNLSKWPGLEEELRKCSVSLVGKELSELYGR